MHFCDQRWRQHDALIKLQGWRMEILVKLLGIKGLRLPSRCLWAGYKSRCAVADDTFGDNIVQNAARMRMHFLSRLAALVLFG